MLRLIARSLCLVGSVMLAGAALAQTEFSADIVNHDSHKADKAPAKVYFGKDKMRFDGRDSSDPRGGGSVIFDLNKQSWVVLMENRGMFEFFRSGDVDNACSDWLKLDRNKGGTCHKVGSETVNGRNTVKYEGTNTKGESSAVWLDSKLRFPVKWDEKNGGGEMQNIKEGPQPASLFEIPAGYNKFDMNNMMQRPQ